MGLSSQDRMIEQTQWAEWPNSAPISNGLMSHVPIRTKKNFEIVVLKPLLVGEQRKRERENAIFLLRSLSDEATQIKTADVIVRFIG